MSHHPSTARFPTGDRVVQLDTRAERVSQLKKGRP